MQGVYQHLVYKVLRGEDILRMEPFITLVLAVVVGVVIAYFVIQAILWMFRSPEGSMGNLVLLIAMFIAALGAIIYKIGNL